MAKREIVSVQQSQEWSFQNFRVFYSSESIKNYSIKLNKSINKTIRLNAKYPAIGFQDWRDLGFFRAIVKATILSFIEYTIHILR